MLPLLGMPTGQAAGALSAGSPSPSYLGQAMTQALGNSNLGGFGTAGALGALAPLMTMGTQAQTPSTPSIGSPASSSLQLNQDHWQSLITMLMQKLGMGSGAGGSSFGSLGALAGQGGVLSPLGASGIYGR